MKDNGGCAEVNAAVDQAVKLGLIQFVKLIDNFAVFLRN